MNLKNSLTLFAFLIALVIGTQTQAQSEMPQPSPAASVSQVVGFTKISIDYSSPGVKGRKIFGELLPYGTTWRAGANAPTKITFSTGVKIGGKDVRPGSYSLMVKPMKNGDWVVYLHEEGKSVYNYMKDNKIDETKLASEAVVSVKVKPQMSDYAMERLAYMISAGDNKTATVMLGWDKVWLSMEVDTKADQNMKRIEAAFQQPEN
ncbi:DUF2911 domain-containing protein [Rapidithrix thailandica]|uniref:DUF2911 domain-containing protein n=1 Tax=Rapidithrix thailandica TaxID=413964 RepID=A0AAW9S0D1_9BACT